MLLSSFLIHQSERGHFRPPFPPSPCSCAVYKPNAKRADRNAGRNVRAPIAKEKHYGFVRRSGAYRPEWGRLALIPALLSFLLILNPLSAADLLMLPTANRALFEAGREDRFYAPTPGKTWSSGMFGCVRSEGAQFHEGIDIRSLERDKQGEPTDPVWATAEGVVVYVNPRAGLSNYGIYVVLRHSVQALELYSLYAHLRELADGLHVGQTVRAGQTIGVLGRTANTRQPITKDRAHLHFELNFLVNGRFAEWARKTYQNERNDHGIFNGQNLLGFDPAAAFLEQRERGEAFNLVAWIRSRPELCRVLVRESDFPFPHRYAPLVQPNAVAAREGIAGYELVFSFAGFPCRIIPRAASEMPGTARYQVVSVNDAEQKSNPCRRLVVRRGKEWELTRQGTLLLDLMTFRP